MDSLPAAGLGVIQFKFVDRPMRLILPPRADALRCVAAKYLLEALAQRIDRRIAQDVAIVSDALIIGALLWLAVGQPLPARLNGPLSPKTDAWAGQGVTSCMPTPQLALLTWDQFVSEPVYAARSGH